MHACDLCYLKKKHWVHTYYSQLSVLVNFCDWSICVPVFRCLTSEPIKNNIWLCPLSPHYWYKNTLSTMSQLRLCLTKAKAKGGTAHCSLKRFSACWSGFSSSTRLCWKVGNRGEPSGSIWKWAQKNECQNVHVHV